MDDAERIRDRATRLYALALKARDDGLVDYATELEELAAEASAHADGATRTQFQQTQQLQPDKEKPRTSSV
jgi:hypothetical protein